MRFIQLIEYSTTRQDEMQELSDRYARENSGRSTARRIQVCADRERPNTFITVAEFDSYESAMQNSNAPETQAFAEQMMKLSDSPPTFRNCDVIKEIQP